MTELEELKKEVELLKEQLNNVSKNKATLTFDMDDHDSMQSFKRSVKSLDAFIALHDIAMEVFRPARKHGYSDPNIQKALDNCGEEVDENGFSSYGHGEELISLLETKFYDILNERGINLDEDL